MAEKVPNQEYADPSKTNAENTAACVYDSKHGEYADEKPAIGAPKESALPQGKPFNLTGGGS